MTSHRPATRRELPTLGDFKIEAENARPKPKKPVAVPRPIASPEVTSAEMPKPANDVAPADNIPVPDAAD